MINCLVGKCQKDAGNVSAPLVMVSIWSRKMTLADKTVYQNGSIDTSFGPLLFSLDSTNKWNIQVSPGKLCGGGNSDRKPYPLPYGLSKSILLLKPQDWELSRLYCIVKLYVHEFGLCRSKLLWFPINLQKWSNTWCKFILIWCKFTSFQVI